MPFDPDSLIDVVAVKLATVTGIGIIHQYRREVRSEAEAAALWIPAGGTKVNAWNVTLGEPTATNVRGPGFNASGTQAGTCMTDLGIVVEGVYGIDDANTSEKTFRMLCWNVMMAFNRVGKLATYVTHQDAMQWERFGYLVLAGMYHVHYAKLRIRFIGQVLP